MSQENVELAKAFFEAWNAGGVDAVREFYDPDVVVRPMKDWPEQGPFFGREAVMQWFEQLRDTWDTLVIETISRIDTGDRIIERHISRGTGQGPAYGAEFTTVTTIRKGKVLYLEFFWDHAEAFEAVGLSQKGAPQENVKVTHRWLAAMSGSPAETEAVVAEFWDVAADYYPVRKFPEAQPCHGLEEIARFFGHQFEDAFSSWELEVRSVIAAGDDRTLASTNLRGEGHGSGLELEGDLYHCFWLRRGRFFRVEDHLTLKGALNAFALEGETLKAADLSE